MCPYDTCAPQKSWAHLVSQRHWLRWGSSTDPGVATPSLGSACTLLVKAACWLWSLLPAPDHRRGLSCSRKPQDCYALPSLPHPRGIPCPCMGGPGKFFLCLQKSINRWPPSKVDQSHKSFPDPLRKRAPARGGGMFLCSIWSRPPSYTPTFPEKPLLLMSWSLGLDPSL